mgnify:CR=1 FL=1
MATFTRQQANALLFEGVQRDLDGAGAIEVLLERQFEAAVRHRSAELTRLAAELSPLLEAMDGRRQQRVTLVRALLGATATMDAYIATLAPEARGAFIDAWRDLEALVRVCQDATIRNGKLLAEQYSVMQRVLHGEEQIYAPR